MKTARVLYYPISAAIVLMSAVGCQEPKPQRDYGFSGGAVPAAVTPPLPAGTEIFPPPPASAPAPVPAVPAVPLQEAPPVPQAAMPSPVDYSPPPRTATYIGTVSAPVPATYVPASTAPASRRLATLYRYAGQYDEYLVRGDAAVSASPVFEGGVRLAAWDGQNAQETSRVAVATAVYFFTVPPEARALSIQVGYGNADVAKGNAIAGFLFVRDRSVERSYGAAAGNTQGGAFDEPAFYGNTYLLPGDQVQTVIDLTTDQRVTDGVLELHLSAGAGQAFDAQYIQVTALAAEPPPTVVRQEMVQQIHDPYVYTYAYYYAGPWACAYPGTYVQYVFFDDALDPFFYGGWITFRACFWNYHPWVYRPAYYTHGDWDDAHRGHLPPRATPHHVTAYRDNWYGRNFHIDQRQAQDPVVIDNRVHHRKVAVADEVKRADFQKYTQTIAEKVRETDHGLKQSYGQGFSQRTQEWKRNPAAAERDLKPFKDKTEGLTKAAAALGSLPVKPVAAVPSSRRTTTLGNDTKAILRPGATATTSLPPSPPARTSGGVTTPPVASERGAGAVAKPEFKKKRTDAGAGVSAATVPPVTVPESSVVTPATSAQPEHVVKTKKNAEWSKTLDDMHQQPAEDRGASKTHGASPAGAASGSATSQQPSPPPASTPAPRVRLVPPPLPAPTVKVISPPVVPNVNPSATVITPEDTTPADRGQDGTDDKRDKRRGRDREVR